MQLFNSRSQTVTLRPDINHCSNVFITSLPCSSQRGHKRRVNVNVSGGNCTGPGPAGYTGRPHGNVVT